MNKPVAYINEEDGLVCAKCFKPFTKELTDEEIIEIANQCLSGATAWHNPDLDPIEFAKAILRKAQEK